MFELFFPFFVFKTRNVCLSELCSDQELAKIELSINSPENMKTFSSFHMIEEGRKIALTLIGNV